MPPAIAKKRQKKKCVCHYGPTNTYFLSSPLGEIIIVSCQNGLHSLEFKANGVDQPLSPDIKIPTKIFAQQWHDNGYTYKPALLTVEWLKIYFSSPKHIGNLNQPSICKLVGRKRGSLQETVWSTLVKEVPFGKTVSYSQFAKIMNNPPGWRAIHSVIQTNPIWLIIPCHRVVDNDVTIKPYFNRCSSKIKEWLLLHEKLATW